MSRESAINTRKSADKTSTVLADFGICLMDDSQTKWWRRERAIGAGRRSMAQAHDGHADCRETSHHCQLLRSHTSTLWKTVCTRPLWLSVCSQLSRPMNPTSSRGQNCQGEGVPVSPGKDPWLRLRKQPSNHKLAQVPQKIAVSTQ